MSAADEAFGSWSGASSRGNPARGSWAEAAARSLDVAREAFARSSSSPVAAAAVPFLVSTAMVQAVLALVDVGQDLVDAGELRAENTDAHLSNLVDAVNRLVEKLPDRPDQRDD